MLRYITLRRGPLLAFVTGSLWAGFDMIGSSNPKVVIGGIILLCLGSLGVWWLFLASLTDAGVEAVHKYPKSFLIGGAIIIVALWSSYGLWIYDGVVVPPQIVSNNQRGGITAHDIFINQLPPSVSQGWGLKAGHLALLKQRMTPFAPPEELPNLISCVLGNSDSTQLAISLVETFRSAGWKLPGSGFNQSVFVGIPVGVTLVLHAETASPPGVIELITTLREAGIEPRGLVDSAVPPNRFQIIIGHRP